MCFFLILALCSWLIFNELFSLVNLNIGSVTECMSKLCTTNITITYITTQIKDAKFMLNNAVVAVSFTMGLLVSVTDLRFDHSEHYIPNI